MNVRYRVKDSVIDVLAEDDEALVLLEDGTLLRLSAVAADVVCLLSVPATLPEVVDHCVSRFGPPPGSPEELVAVVVAELVAQGVLESEPQP